jgi:hypothetical protein
MAIFPRVKRFSQGWLGLGNQPRVVWLKLKPFSQPFPNGMAIFPRVKRFSQGWLGLGNQPRVVWLELKPFSQPFPKGKTFFPRLAWPGKSAKGSLAKAQAFFPAFSQG